MTALPSFIKLTDRSDEKSGNVQKIKHALFKKSSFEISPFTLCQSMMMCIITDMIIMRFFALSCNKWLTKMLLRHGFSIPGKANDSKRSADKPKQTLKKKPNFL